jgi:hypothetical protein
MAKKQTLTVTTEYGTFTRTTARTYTHVVVVQDYSDAYQAKLRALAATGDSWWTAEKVEQQITDGAVAGVLGWSGSLQLARKVATGRLGRLYRTVAIVDVATGATI